MPCVLPLLLRCRHPHPFGYTNEKKKETNKQAHKIHHHHVVHVVCLFVLFCRSTSIFIMTRLVRTKTKRAFGPGGGGGRE